MSIAEDNGTYFDLPAFSTSGAKDKTFDGRENKVFEAEIKVDVGTRFHNDRSYGNPLDGTRLRRPTTLPNLLCAPHHAPQTEHR
jgi:hypothetical protein